MSTMTLPHSRTGAGDELLGELIEEVSRKLEAGEAVDLDVFIVAHPERAETLRLVLPALAVLADLGRSAVREPHAGSVPESLDGAGLGELGDYRILRELGRGGMGVVYEAVQISLRRRVALKVLPFAAAMDPTQLRRFQTEALAAAQLHHTNIVPVHSVGSERGVHYYAMQFIEGQTLAAVIQECRRIESPVDPHPPLRGTFSLREKVQENPLPRGEGGRRPGEGRLETGSGENPHPLRGTFSLREKVQENPLPRGAHREGFEGGVFSAHAEKPLFLARSGYLFWRERGDRRPLP